MLCLQSHLDTHITILPPLGKLSKWPWLYLPSTPRFTRAAHRPHPLQERARVYIYMTDKQKSSQTLTEAAFWSQLSGAPQAFLLFCFFSTLPSPFPISTCFLSVSEPNVPSYKEGAHDSSFEDTETQNIRLVMRLHSHSPINLYIRTDLPICFPAYVYL